MRAARAWVVARTGARQAGRHTPRSALGLHGGLILSVLNPPKGEPVKTSEHENAYFRDAIGYSIGAIGIHRLGLILALAAGVFSALCILISGTIWNVPWPTFWEDFWRNLPIFL